VKRLIQQVLAILLIGGTLRAQVRSSTALGETGLARAVATRAISNQLDLAHLRRVRRASPDSVSCAAGVAVVQSFSLLPGVASGDTLLIPVRFEVLGAVASSEASFMFLPSPDYLRADSAAVVLVRRRGAWVVESIRNASARRHASVAAARAFFRLPADERQRLDSASRAAGSSRPPA